MIILHFPYAHDLWNCLHQTETNDSTYECDKTRIRHKKNKISYIQREAMLTSRIC